MNRFSTFYLAIIISLVAVFPALACHSGEGVKLGQLSISSSWARATAGQAKAGGAFLTITNGGPADKLIGLTSDVAPRTEIHTSIYEDNVMKMRRVPSVDIPAGETVSMKPGGFHIMFIGLHAPLKEGETFPLTLNFEKSGSVTVQVKVGGVGSMGHGCTVDGDGHSDAPMDHGDMTMGH